MFIASLQDWIFVLKPRLAAVCVLISQVQFPVETLLTKSNSQFKLKLGIEIKTKDDPKFANFSSLLGPLTLLQYY